jgi:acyl carrier protein
MTDEEIFQRVKKVVVEQMRINEDEVRPEVSFTEDLGADSLTVVELVMQLEEEFGVDIPDDDVPNLKTVQDAVNYIQSKLSA